MFDLDFHIGLLCQIESNGYEMEPEPGIYELPFVGNYSRVPMTQIDWMSPDGITMFNACDIIFPRSTFKWGKITHFGLWLSPDGVDCVCVGDLNRPVNICKDSIVKFLPLKINILVEVLEEAINEFGGEQYND